MQGGESDIGWTGFVFRGWHVALLLVLVLVVAGVIAVLPLGSSIAQSASRSQAADTLRGLRDPSLDEVLRSPLTGKAFVLGVLVAQDPDWGDLVSVRRLFSVNDVPDDDTLRALIPRYRALTLESLRYESDLGRLTTHVGRAFRIAPEDLPDDAPIVADLRSVRDHAIIFSARGGVWSLGRADLGLKPDDPLQAGRDSPSRILRQLSAD